jgi:opacity protein-like surface antigen
MFGRKAIAALAVILLSTPALAIDEGLYVGLGGGVSFTQDPDITLSGPGGTASGNLGINTGFGVIGALGFQWKNGFAVEGEIGYRRGSGGNSTLTLGALSATGDVDGNVDALSFLANGRYGFDTGTSLTPFILGGVGVARVGANDIGAGGLTIVDDTDWVFAYQAGAGVNVALGDGFSAEATYRFFGTTGPDFTGIAGIKVEADGIKNHSIFVVLKYTFGGITQ